MQLYLKCVLTEALSSTVISKDETFFIFIKRKVMKDKELTCEDSFYFMLIINSLANDSCSSFLFNKKVTNIEYDNYEILV